ncbi:MAG: DUF1573 domain-containing protein [Bacteroidetes bacterium]|nr:DUF1573 domain-containing protein [Bacteroidota bacterium]MBP7398744.1 DUF1573 domain-containing protein [Chitinophagales bacterium]MBK7109715.1 DUF1573 domain-containing protein [Bacteroidota bacterium]MBP8754568.1 DUF1573 domain-containing protein [Chitinophagales bacterium]MBP9189207.1 DUF1573 domain-containing protein [Chitinophagales bacterium]
MNIKQLFIIITIVASTLLISSCKNEKNAQDDDLLDTDLIQNSNSAEGTVNTDKAPVMLFERDIHDFGEIIQGEIATTEFKFSNTGKSDLIIASARASCGCTVPEYPKEPIKPGESGVIKVSYNSEGRKDAFNKTVTITANTIPNENRIKVKGIVVVPKDKQ